jgi:adenine-specific DNA-methyltransferase
MKFDKQELEKKIRDAKDLSNEDKSNLLQLLKEKKTYGLVWENSTEDAFEQLKTQLPILREVKERQIVNDTETENYPNHILIEGDNLQALVALTYTHAGMIDVIYIDPPYNTGKEDFVYNDSFVDAEDSYRHSKWLSFMEKRLKIAKTLLSEKGVIFISVDDNEQAQLKLLLDDVFNRKTLDRGTLIWVNKGSTKGFSKIVKNHEYILAYSNNPDAIISLYNKNFPAEGELIEERLQIKRSPKNPLCQVKFPKGLPIRDITDIRFEGHVGNGTNRIDIVSGDMVFRDGILQNDVVLEASFPYRNQMEKFFKAMETGEVVYDTKGQQWLEVFFSKTGVPHYSKERGFTILSSLIDDVSNSGFSDLKALKLEEKFSNPKPIALIRRILSHFSTSNYIILDFFAGSGTTLHATMQLNAEDGGNRQCILVTNNENNICEEVTYERNKRVIEGYTKPNGEFVEGLKQNNLRYYKVDFKDRKQSHQSNRDLAMNLKDLLCIKENIYKEQKMFGALPLTGKEQMLRHFEENGRGMLMVYDTRVIPFITKEIEKMDLKEQPLKIYIFADGAYPYTDDFASVIDKVSLIPMPYAFHRAIKDVLPEEYVAKVDDTELTSEEQKEMMAEAIEAENNEKKED